MNKFGLLFAITVTMLVIAGLVLVLTAIPRGEGSVLVDTIEDVIVIQSSRFFSVQSVVNVNGGYLVIVTNEQVVLWNTDDYYKEKGELSIDGPG